ncbi:MAG: hypothetical protein A4E63_01840 [Syntrophorhabdus sp. PtaU1.Bin050]|nr:MAG: hypothetical protein A4E63_01840 [Syntrophorhabdus sp. PtaU1.Bin050]
MRIIVLFFVLVFFFVGACSNKPAENASAAKGGTEGSAEVKASSLVGTYTYSKELIPLRGTETLKLQGDGTASYTFNIRGDEQQLKSYDKNILEKTGTYEVIGQRVRTNIVIDMGQEIKEFNFQGSGVNPGAMTGIVVNFLKQFFPINSPTTLEFQINDTQLSIGSRKLSKE